MKVEYIEDGMEIFFQNYFFKNIDWNKKEEVIEKIKEILLKINEQYNLNMRGLYKIKVYPHKIGVFIQVISIDEELYSDSLLDLIIVILFNKELFLKINDYLYIENSNLNFINKNNSYYLDLKNIDAINIIKYIEFGKIVDSLT